MTSLTSTLFLSSFKETLQTKKSFKMFIQNKPLVELVLQSSSLSLDPVKPNQPLYGLSYFTNHLTLTKTSILFTSTSAGDGCEPPPTTHLPYTSRLHTPLDIMSCVIFCYQTACRKDNYNVLLSPNLLDANQSL